MTVTQRGLAKFCSSKHKTGAHGWHELTAHLCSHILYVPSLGALVEFRDTAVRELMSPHVHIRDISNVNIMKYKGSFTTHKKNLT